MVKKVLKGIRDCGLRESFFVALPATYLANFALGTKQFTLGRGLAGRGSQPRCVSAACSVPADHLLK